MIDELKERFDALRIRIEDIGRYLDPSRIDVDLAALEKELAREDFWKDRDKAQEVLKRRTRLESLRKKWAGLSGRVEEIDVFFELAGEGEDVAKDLKAAVTALEERVARDEIETLLSGEHDARNAIVELHPGEGGTDAMDFAEMLLRMYLRWCEQRGFRSKVLDYQVGDEAGVKSVTFMVEGEYAYGLLRGELGVHRLVRISPFDAARRRHTSFVSCSVVPELPDDVDVQIEPKDLRVDTYRSSGAGGQHVNVTDSAVRITHLPTNIVVSCQNERSQHRNRDVAMKVLRARLYELELKKRQEELAKTTGVKRDIGFGSQIRSYVLQPYQMAKDHRTKHEVGDVGSVLDGKIDPFIKSYLVKAKRGELSAAADEEM
ncbi:MAG: peptide chain release factor 2 [Acidobacteriota bacterium]